MTAHTVKQVSVSDYWQPAVSKLMQASAASTGTSKRQQANANKQMPVRCTPLPNSGNIIALTKSLSDRY